MHFGVGEGRLTVGKYYHNSESTFRGWQSDSKMAAKEPQFLVGSHAFVWSLLTTDRADLCSQ